MTFKQRFNQQHEKLNSTPKQFSLEKIRDQSPDCFDANRTMEGHESANRCDYFVLCDCNHSTTGIYVIEVKSGTPEIDEIRKQLQSGADFMGTQLNENDKFDFSPTIVAGGMPSSWRRKNQNNSVILKGKKRLINHVKVSGPLEKITISVQ